MNLTYIQKIDFFRALSILLVVLFHLNVSLFQGGFLGVDVFFVISGFLITRLITAELNQTQKFNFKRFYINRARRLLPSLFLMMILVFIGTYFIFSPSDFITSSQSIFFTAVIISNFFFFFKSGYFDNASELEPLLHTWSLGIEEQFYLLWPITLVIIYKVFKKRLSLILLSILVLSFLLTAFVCHSNGGSNVSFLNSIDQSQLKSAIFYLLPFRVFEFMIGALAFNFYSKKIEINFSKILLHLIGLFLIILSAIFLTKELKYLGILNIIPCIGIFILLISKAPSQFNALYNNKHVALIGKASYTWYIFHWPIFAISKYYLERNFHLWESLFLFFSTLLLSIVIYKYFENPIRNKNKSGDLKLNRSFILAMLFFIAMSGGMSYHVTENNGWLFRLNQNQIEFASKANTLDEYHKTNWGGADFKPGIITKPNTKKKRIDFVLLGESHAGHFLFGMDSILVKKHNKRLFVPNLMNPSAIYLPDIIPTHLENNKVQKRLNRAIKILKNNPKATLILSHYWAVQLKRSNAKIDNGRTVALQNNNPSFEVLMSKLDKLLDIVGQRKVIIFGTGPVMPYSNKLNHIERKLKPGSRNKDFSTTKFKPDQNYYKINTFLEEYTKNKPNLTYIDPRIPFCSGKECFAQKDGIIYLSDWDHLSKDGSLKLISHFENEILNTLR